MKTLLILGAGGYGKTVADIAGQLGNYRQIFFLDDGKAGQPGIPGTCEEFLSFSREDTDIYPAFGNNATRLAWLKRILEAGCRVPTLVHPAAYVSPTVRLGLGVVVLPGAVVNTGVTLENGCIVNIGALVDHDVVMEAGSHAAPGAIIKAGNRIPEGMKVESGTVIENCQYPL